MPLSSLLDEDTGASIKLSCEWIGGCAAPALVVVQCVGPWVFVGGRSSGAGGVVKRNNASGTVLAQRLFNFGASCFRFWSSGYLGGFLQGVMVARS